MRGDHRDLSNTGPGVKMIRPSVGNSGVGVLLGVSFATDFSTRLVPSQANLPCSPDPRMHMEVVGVVVKDAARQKDAVGRRTAHVHVSRNRAGVSRGHETRIRRESVRIRSFGSIRDPRSCLMDCCSRLQQGNRLDHETSHIGVLREEMVDGMNRI